MYEIGDLIKIKEDHRWGYVYDIIKDTYDINIYQLVWFEEDLYKPWPQNKSKILYWEDELVESTFKRLKNGNKVIVAR